MSQFALLAKALGIPDSEAPASVDHPHKIVPVLVAWRDWLAANEPERLTELGKDFARAISTFVRASSDHTDLLLRSSDANRAIGPTVRSRGPTQWPARGIVGSSPVRGRSRRSRGGAWGEPQSRAVAANMSAPEIGTLLGLARDADALRLTGQDAALNVADDAKALLDAGRNARAPAGLRRRGQHEPDVCRHRHGRDAGAKGNRTGKSDVMRTWNAGRGLPLEMS